MILMLCFVYLTCGKEIRMGYLSPNAPMIFDAAINLAIDDFMAKGGLGPRYKLK